MVIDKTTGKGCAWSIVSKTVTKQLIAEGIIGKLIGKKTWRKGYTPLHVVQSRYRVYVTATPQESDESTEESMWTPSFVDAETWRQAVSKFSDFERLDQSVEKYLLPEMEEYLRSITDVELVSMVRDFLIDYGVICKPISQRKGNTYYFNENEVYSLDKKSTQFPYTKQRRFHLFDIKGETCFNMRVWRKAVSKFQIGMTLNEYIGVFLRTDLVHYVPKKLSPVDRLVQSIATPVFERVPGNTDESTFDRIRVTVGLPRYHFASWEALQKEVKEYQPEIYRRILQRLEQDRQFKRYGMPINFLKLSNAILLRDFSLEYIFELKDLKANQ